MQVWTNYCAVLLIIQKFPKVSICTIRGNLYPGETVWAEIIAKSLLSSDGTWIGKKMQ